MQALYILYKNRNTFTKICWCFENEIGWTWDQISQCRRIRVKKSDEQEYKINNIGKVNPPFPPNSNLPLSLLNLGTAAHTSAMLTSMNTHTNPHLHLQHFCNG